MKKKLLAVALSVAVSGSMMFPGWHPQHLKPKFPQRDINRCMQNSKTPNLKRAS